MTSDMYYALHLARAAATVYVSILGVLGKQENAHP